MNNNSIIHFSIIVSKLLAVVLIGLSTEPVLAADSRSINIVPQQQSLTGRPTDVQPLLPEYQDFSQQGLPEAQNYLPPVTEQNDFIATPGASFELKEVLFHGHSVFSSQELSVISAPFINQLVSLADLEELRLRLTRYYTESGYVNSGVLLPDQHVTEGIVHYRIIEGHLIDIQVTGNQGLRESYIRKRILGDPKEVFNTHDLQNKFQSLLQDPLIKRLNGEIRPGDQIGDALLDLEVTRARAYDFFITLDNHATPTTGENEINLNGTIRNLTGFGDVLTLDAELSEGVQDFVGSFSIPISADNTRLSVSYEESDADVVEESLKVADIHSEYQSASLGISHPFYQSLNRSFSMALLYNWRKSETFLLGIGTPFSEGVELDGSAGTSVFRFSQDYVDRQADTVLALRSMLNFGVDVLDATINKNDLPDSRFVSWIGQIQHARRLSELGRQLLVRGNVQLSNDKLLPLEQIAVGGPDTVRGYRTNQLVRDNGYNASIEYRHPVMGNPFNKKQLSMQVAGFYDLGDAWNQGHRDDHQFIDSAGIGFLWQWQDFNAELYWAHPFKNMPESPEYYLQDDGLSFRLRAHF
jgi:hemolysin activation/secretion protein